MGVSGRWSANHALLIRYVRTNCKCVYECLLWWTPADARLFLTDVVFRIGIVYRYAVRMDDNPMLRQGVIGAFAITRSWALVSPPPTCSVVPLNCGPPLGYFNWDMIFQGLVALAETGVACSAAAYVIEAAFARGWIQRCK